MRNFELPGEAATHIPEKTRHENPQVPWRLIIATHNQGYPGIDTDTLRSIIGSEIPAMLPLMVARRENSQ